MSSLIVPMRVREVQAELGVDTQMEHIDILSPAFKNSNLCIVGKDMTITREVQKIDEDTVIRLDRILGKEKILDKLKTKLGV